MEANGSIPSTAPQATLGQRLYATRRRADLTVEELANAAGLPVETVTIAEADGPLTHDAVAVLEALISVLSRH
jgi:transcriptional regulator with XRE-family HTH domain